MGFGGLGVWGFEGFGVWGFGVLGVWVFGGWGLGVGGWGLGVGGLEFRVDKKSIKGIVAVLASIKVSRCTKPD